MPERLALGEESKAVLRFARNDITSYRLLSETKRSNPERMRRDCFVAPQYCGTPRNDQYGLIITASEEK